MNPAHAIYRALFNRPCPGEMAERFDYASQYLLADYTADEQKQFEFAVTHISDLEALELVCRYLQRLPVLVAHFRMMVYLSETMPENRKAFVNVRDAGWSAILTMAYSGVRTVTKFIKGLYLIRIMKNV